jgi:hypothetical protein
VDQDWFDSRTLELVILFKTGKYYKYRCTRETYALYDKGVLDKRGKVSYGVAFNTYIRQLQFEQFDDNKFKAWLASRKTKKERSWVIHRMRVRRSAPPPCYL